MKRVIRYSIIFGVLALLVVVIAMQLNKNKHTMESNAEVANQKVTVFPVSVVTPKTESLSQNFTISGEFEPLHELNFVSETSGRVVSVKVDDGDYVRKGQVIAQLDNEQTRIDLNLAEANLEKAENDLERYTILADANAVTEQQLKDIKLSVISAQSRVQTLKRQMKISSIVSPISGTINGLSLEVGSYVAPGTAIAEIIDVSSFKMHVSLLDHEVVQIKDGEKISVIPDLYSNAPIEGKIVFISSKADGSGKYLVEIEFKNSSTNPLKAGMTGVAKFELGGEKTATLIPVKCLAGSIQDPTVFIVNGDSVNTRKIKVGGIYGDKIEVTGGLVMTDKVVETGIANLAEGAKIEIID